jgi:hypothetical protein
LTFVPLEKPETSSTGLVWRHISEALIAFLQAGRAYPRIRACRRASGDALSPCFKDVLADPAGDALILVEAGDLAKRSSLRLLRKLRPRSC